MPPTSNLGPWRREPVRKLMRLSAHGPRMGAIVLETSTYAPSVAGSITWLAIRSESLSRNSLRSGHVARIAGLCAVGDAGALGSACADLAGSCLCLDAVVLEHPAPATESKVAVAMIATRPATRTALRSRAV